MRKRRERIIEQLRRTMPGDWKYDGDMREWVRADGTKVYARAHISIGVDGCESYYTRWYKQVGDAAELVSLDVLRCLLSRPVP